MAKASKGRRRSRSRAEQARTRRLISALLVGVAALAWARWGPQLRERAGLSGPAVPERSASFRIVSWNLANFRGAASGHDLARMREILAELDPDVIAVQEIKDPEALARLLPDYELHLSEAGGRGGQRLGVAVRRDRVELLASEEHAQLSLGGRVRPGLSAYVRARDGGPDLWLLVVHLKAMPDGVEQRREQWPMLAALAQSLPAATPGGAEDTDLIVLGDFNSTGPRSAGREGPSVEQAELAEVLAPAGLRRLSNATGCSAYYDGARRDAWKEPSEIDLVWARGLGDWLADDAQVYSGTHCAARACEDARSTEAYPLRDYVFVSDHCPVIVDLGL